MPVRPDIPRSPIRMKKPRLLVHVSKTATQKSQKIAQEIRWLIATGQLKAGEQLPSVRDAATSWSQSKDTVHRAYKLLLEKGYITDNGEKGLLPGFMVSTEVKPLTENERQKYLEDMLAQTFAKSRKLGFSAQEIEGSAIKLLKKIQPRKKAADKK